MIHSRPQVIHRVAHKRFPAEVRPIQYDYGMTEPKDD